MKNIHNGSSLDDFLQEEGLFEECNAEAVKRVIAWEHWMTARIMTKKVHAQISVVDILDDESSSTSSLVMAGTE